MFTDQHRRRQAIHTSSLFQYPLLIWMTLSMIVMCWLPYAFGDHGIRFDLTVYWLKRTLIQSDLSRVAVANRTLTVRASFDLCVIATNCNTVWSQQLIIETNHIWWSVWQSYSIGAITPSVTHLSFGQKFNQPIAIGAIPLSLAHLTFGDHFSQPITIGSILSSVTRSSGLISLFLRELFLLHSPIWHWWPPQSDYTNRWCPCFSYWSWSSVQSAGYSRYLVILWSYLISRKIWAIIHLSKFNIIITKVTKHIIQWLLRSKS